MEQKLRYFSTFSGIGGFEIGIGERGECVGYSEIDKYAAKIYQSHFPSHINYGDITAINEQELPDFDLLVGGFPCQSFSIAGKRGGFNDTRGTLFFDIARIAEAKRPRLLLLENVKGLLSHEQGRTFFTIIATLDELGYDCQWQVLNSKDFGVPQNRERVFIVGHLRGTPRPEVFPFAGKGEGTAIDALVQANNPAHSSRRVFLPESTAPTLRARARGDETGPPLVAVAGTINRGEFKETGGIALNLPASYYKGHDNHGARPMVLQRGRGFNKGGAHELSPPLGSHSWDQNNTLNGIRRLTPTECERLQGFPDGWTEGTSDTQRYKCCGNAVTTSVISAIVSRLVQ
jgi:DNA (cytosine-5)-methyltransferase 1